MAGSDDRLILAAAERLLRDRERVSVHELLAELRWAEERRLPLMRGLKALIDGGYLEGKILPGDATILDVMLTAVTEKGFDRLGIP